MCFVENKFSFLLSICVDVDCWVHGLCVYSALVDNAKQFFQNGYTNFHSWGAWQAQSVEFKPHGGCRDYIKIKYQKKKKKSIPGRKYLQNIYLKSLVFTLHKEFLQLNGKTGNLM